MDEKLKEELQLFAHEIRLTLVKTLHNLGFGHYGGCLSIVECLAVLYGKVLNVDPKNPKKPDRDYFIMSKGHAGPAQYAALALKGFFPMEVLSTLNKNGTRLPSHLDRLLTPGVDMTAGSLGQGISVACGIAKSLKMDKSPQRVYSVVGDGELNEGQCWEAFQFADHNKLDNLIVFIDNNKRQLDGYITDISSNMDYTDKFTAFGFHTQNVKGDDVSAIYSAVLEAHKQEGRPHAIILDTVKGQGFKYLEEKLDNHHVRPTQEEKDIIADFIACAEKKLGGGHNA